MSQNWIGLSYSMCISFIMIVTTTTTVMSMPHAHLDS